MSYYYVGTAELKAIDNQKYTMSNFGNILQGNKKDLCYK